MKRQRPAGRRLLCCRPVRGDCHRLPGSDLKDQQRWRRSARGLGSGRTREELAAIRTWAREHGHQVADHGMVPKRILEAYDAAHPAPVRKAG
ncbi:histone-like nucleoid-structuring protein Lsr2 [Streptomyces sp. YS-3]|uniref:Lsr2 family DNA-binding protein n=1 Tax=Streptomyces sp. YS-3 TaxID=3381352 RepID=UPI003862324B